MGRDIFHHPRLLQASAGPEPPHPHRGEFPKKKTLLNPTKSCPYCEVELLSLLLVCPSLGNAGFAHERLGHRGFHRLHGVAVLEAVRDIKVLYGDNVLDCLQRGLHGLLHLPTRRGELRTSRFDVVSKQQR